MATPKQFEKQNMIWKGWPEDDDRQEVLDLPVYQMEGASVSCWQLNQLELEQVAVSGEVWISVQGRHPPIYVTGLQKEVIPE